MATCIFYLQLSIASFQTYNTMNNPIITEMTITKRTNEQITSQRILKDEEWFEMEVKKVIKRF